MPDIDAKTESKYPIDEVEKKERAREDPNRSWVPVTQTDETGDMPDLVVIIARCSHCGNECEFSNHLESPCFWECDVCETSLANPFHYAFHMQGTNMCTFA